MAVVAYLAIWVGEKLASMAGNWFRRLDWTTGRQALVWIQGAVSLDCLPAWHRRRLVAGRMSSNWYERYGLIWSASRAGRGVLQ